MLGVALLIVYVIWSKAEIASDIDRMLEKRARYAAQAYREKLALALGPRDPASPETWSRLDPELEESFRSTPNLRGIVIRLPGSKPAVIGPRPEELTAVPALAAPPRVDDIATRLEHGEGPPRVLVSFLVPRFRDPVAVAQANVHLQFAPMDDLEHRIFQKFQFGALLVGTVIYFLAVLGHFISRQGERAVSREREKAVRLKAIGEVAGAIAHELRNPLNAISLSFQVIGETLKNGGAVEESRAGDLERARGEVQKISKVVDNFVSFARLSDLNMTDVEVGDLAREAFEPVQAVAAAASVTADLRVEGPTRLRGDRDKLRDMLATTMTAVLDAVKAAPGTLDVSVAGSRNDVTVTIRGRSQRVDSRRVSNFASARRAWDEPVGLSLTIARTWIDCHGGTVSGPEPTADRAELVIVLPKGMV
jgi:signal transduction histidine kinase